VNRWQNTIAPQHMLLSADAAYGFGTTRRVSEIQLSKPAKGRRS
jgi:hypothetical protein